MIKVRERELNIDVLEELDYFDWGRARNRGHELTALSPFRDDNSPSFSINLETGQWIDFGSAGTGEIYGKGNLITLLSFLRKETPIETEEYLIGKYALDLMDVDSISLNVDLWSTDAKTETIIDIEEYKQYAFRSPYLAGRGISEKVQRAFKIGFDKASNAVAIPWFDVQGNMINIKFRSTRSKYFYYYPEGQALRNHIFGMHFVYQMKCEKVVIVESEIDCLFLWTHGFPAIALGGSKLNRTRQQLLLRSPIKTLILATDNDEVGREIKEKISHAVVGYKELHEITFPENAKDINDMDPKVLKQVVNDAKPANLILF